MSPADSGIPSSFQFPLLDHMIRHPLSVGVLLATRRPTSALSLPHHETTQHVRLGNSCLLTADSLQTIVRHSSIQVLIDIHQIITLGGRCIVGKLVAVWTVL